MTDPWFTPTRAWAVDLTRVFSQTDTPGERDFAPFLQQRLAALPHFRRHPDHLRQERTRSDPRERSLLFALVKGVGPRTLILTGHYDVVGIDNYGALAEWACDPDALLPRLTALLREEAGRGPGQAPADRLAMADLESGDFLPGRGLLDMKAGLAAGLAVLERWSQLPPGDRPGSLLFIAVPDEEIASNGIRTAGALLPGLAAEWGLEFEGAVNLDASDDPGDGSAGQAVYFGSVGKLLPSFYLVGRETHAGSPFSGVNAALLAAELTRLIECRVDLADSLNGVLAAPPTCLKQEENKIHYDVTTPVSAWCYYNWLTLGQPLSAVLETAKRLAGQALKAAVGALRESAAEYARRSGQALLAPDWHPRVYTFEEVHQAALEKEGAEFGERFDALQSALAADPGLDTPACCRRLTEAAWSASGLTGPAAVVGFAAIHYPPLSLENAPPKMDRFRRVLSAAAEGLSAERGTPITFRPFFPGISDMSFLGGRLDAAETRALAANVPAWEGRARFDYSAVAALGIPAVNIGPWGRDYHQRLERVHMPYSFGVLPELLWRIALGTLGE